MTTPSLDLESKYTLKTPTDLGNKAAVSIALALNTVLADIYALYLKTKNFHWHVSGPHFRDYHLMFDEQATEIFAMTDAIAERVRKMGGRTLRSIGEISKLQQIKDNESDFVEAQDMLIELCSDNRQLIEALRKTHAVCSSYNDSASTSLIELWIDETEKRTWFLYESSRHEHREH